MSECYKPNELAQFLRFIETCYEFWGSVVTFSPTWAKFADPGLAKGSASHA